MTPLPPLNIECNFSFIKEKKLSHEVKGLINIFRQNGRDGILRLDKINYSLIGNEEIKKEQIKLNRVYSTENNQRATKLWSSCCTLFNKC